ncbi:MAG: DUF5049 domain-containing protein [Victivallaceae bacterium]|nr:DUF5049 domain-containing protein [Victivallaceae bacterium]
MIKAQIHETTLDGFPLDETGTVIQGNDAYEAVEAMKIKSPFTADMAVDEYIDYVLGKIMPEAKPTGLDATEFLTQLAARGLISFLPEDDLCPANLMEVLETIRQSGVTNMFDVPVVTGLAEQMGEAEVAGWINTHQHDYGEIILHGRPNPESQEVK